MNDLRTLSDEETRGLAAMERDMDAGRVPYVALEGTHRVAVSPEVMAHFGLPAGQRVTQAIFIAILEREIAICKQKIAIERHRAGTGGPS